MMRSVLAIAALPLLCSATVLAQVPGPTSVPSTPPPSAPAAPPSCVVGDHAGIDDNDAKAVTNLVCREVERLGGAVGTTFRVDLNKLGSQIVLTVAAESPPGTVRNQRQIQVSRIEDIPVAVPRVVSSLMRGTAIDDPKTPPQQATTTPVVEDRPPPDGAPKDAPLKKRPREHADASVIGVLAPLASGFNLSPGLAGGVGYDIDRLTIVGEGRFAIGTTKTESTVSGYVAFGGGIRYFMTDGDTVPFIGGGLELLYTDVKTPTFQGDHWSLAAWGEIGLQFLRTQRVHLSLALRVDLPSSAIRGSNCYSLGSQGYPTTCSNTSLYYVPTGLVATLTF